MLCITSVWYFGVWAADTAEFYAGFFVFFCRFLLLPRDAGSSWSSTFQPPEQIHQRADILD